MYLNISPKIIHLYILILLASRYLLSFINKCERRSSLRNVPIEQILSKGLP